MSKTPKTQKTKKIDYAIVGGGAAGLYLLQNLLSKGVSPQDIVVLEASPSLGGRAKSALHLVDAEASQAYPVLTSSLLSPLRIRWEKEWVPFDNVKWESKEWVAVLPQWKFLDHGLKSLLLDLAPTAFENKDEETDSFHFKTPVSSIEQVDDLWHLTTPQFIYEVKNVFWTAGLKPFQNACGKHEAQRFLVSNESYDQVAADYRGGIAFDLTVPKNVEWEEGVDREAVMGVPVRFEGKYHLMIFAFHEDDQACVLKSLTHTHQEILIEPKAVTAFQKAIRRVVKTLFKSGDFPEGFQEKWVVSDRVFGHQLGTPWLLNSSFSESGLFFVGDESSASQTLDTLGAFQSVQNVMGQFFEAR